MLKVAGGGGVQGGVVYSGTWNASTNTPTLTSGIGTKGNYYVVSVAGNTNLDGITDWEPGDWAIFNGTAWEKVDNSEVIYVSNVATGTGLTGGPITTTGTISLANTTVAAGVYGDAANVPQVTFNAQGQATNVTNVAIAISVANVANAVPDTREIIAGVGLDGGGNLSANVTIDLANTAVVPATYGGGTNAAEVTVDAQGRITAAANVAIPQGTVTNVATGTGLDGGPITSTGTISLANTAVVPGQYGDSGNVAQITIDAQGRITAAANVAVTGGGGGGSNVVVTNVVTISAGSVVEWENNDPIVIPWENDSFVTIDWLSGVYFVTANNATILVNCASETLSTLLPGAATVSGQQFKVKKIDSSNNAATISTTSSQTIDGNLTYALSTQYQSATVQSDGSNWWITAKVA